MMHPRFRNLDPLTIRLDQKLYFLYVGLKVTIQEPGKTWWTGKIVDVDADRNTIKVDYSGGDDLGAKNEKTWHSVFHVVMVNDPDQE